MKIYLLVVMGAALFSLIIAKYEKGSKIRWFWISILIVFLILVAGFRVDQALYSDEWNYRIGFSNYANTTFNELLHDNDPGFAIINWILSRIINNPQILILFTAAFINISIILFIEKFSNNIFLSVFMYVAGGAYFTSMNIIRQYCAIAIILFGFQNIIDKKFWHFCFYVLIAATIHWSAMIMLVFYFLINYRDFSRHIFSISTISILVMINFSALINVLQGGIYDRYVLNYETEGYGVGIPRILFWVSIALFVFKKRNLIKQTIPFQIMNGYYISTILLVVSRAYVYINRLDYLGICNYIVVPAVIGAFKIDGRKLAQILMVALFFFYGYYQVVYIGHLSYKNIIFTFL